MREFLQRNEQDQSIRNNWNANEEENLSMLNDEEDSIKMGESQPLIQKMSDSSELTLSKNKKIAKNNTEEEKSNFEKLTINYDALFDKAWKDSWPNGPDKNVVEWGGILLKTTELTPEGAEKSVTYSIHDLHPGQKGSIRKNDYSTIPSSTDTTKVEIEGDFHTHPYSKKEMKSAKRQKADFDGNGDIFSSNDFITYAQLDEKYRGKGKIFVVVAGTVTYGVEILEAEKAKTLFQNESFLREIDYADSKFKDDGGSYPDKVFKKYQEILTDFGGEENGGIKFHMKKD